MRSRLYAGNPQSVDSDQMNTLSIRETTNHLSFKSNDHVTLEQSAFDSIDSSESMFHDKVDYFALSSPSTQVTDVSSFFSDTQIASLVNYQWDNVCVFDTTTTAATVLECAEGHVDTNSIATSTGTAISSDQNSLSDICTINAFESPSLSELIDLLPVSPSLQTCQL